MLPARIVERVADGMIVVTEAGLRLRCGAEQDGELDGSADVSVLLRPERVRVEMPGGAVAPGQNRVSARIGDITYLGEDLHLSLDLAGGDRLRASLKNANAAQGWIPRQAVEVVIDAGDLRLLRR